MPRPKQLQFSGRGFNRPKDWFGGGYLKKSHAKTKRPLQSGLPLHLVLTTEKLPSYFSLRHPRCFERVNSLVRSICAKYGFRIHEYANVGNHLHLLISFKSKGNWPRFIRELTGRIAQSVQDLRGPKKGFHFWKQRPFTRIVRGWQRAYRIAKDYLVLNQLEGAGLISRLDRRQLESTA